MDIKMVQWKQYILDHWVITPEERTLLQEGPKSLSQAWHLQALKYRYESTKPSGNVED
jgi:hypothetical protein|tara:strand:- start:241 stop:414 length:174 start_codon:yes stop_codon:yes gene_type:complete